MPNRTQRTLECWQCRTYDRERRRCRVGKANPPTKRLSIEVAQALGAQALCLHNPHRDLMLLRMHLPRRRFIWSDPAATVTSPARYDVEIIEEYAAPADRRRGARIA